MKKLVLQAGFPKCGSTSIFAALKHSARTLMAQDIFILNNRFVLHRNKDVLVSPLMELKEALDDPEVATRMKAALIKAIHECPDGGTIIICTEILSEPEMEQLFTGLERLCDIELVFYFRPQADWIASAWKQWDLKSGLSLPNVMQSAVATRRPDYLGTAKAWEAAVPGIRITPRPFLREFMVNGHPSYDFLNLLGVAVRTDPALEERMNSSMDYALLYLFQRNSAQIFVSRHDNVPYRGLMKNLPETYRRTNSPMFNQQESDFIAESFHADNVALARRYMGMEAGQAEAFVREHFRKTVTEPAFTDFSEQEIMKRAGMILQEVTGVAGDPDQLLLDYVDQVRKRRDKTGISRLVDAGIRLFGDGFRRSGPRASD